MLKEWFGGNAAPAGENAAPTEETKAQQAAAARKARLEADPELAKELTEEELEEQKDAAIRKKLREAAKEGPANPNNMVAYDGMFRGISKVLMDGQQAQGSLHDGLEVNVARNVHNVMVSSKWTLGNPQQSSWEGSIQMNGFGDVMQAAWNSQNRWQLMYQRVFRSGALGVMQFMGAPPQAMAMGGPSGTFFGMLQVPWTTGGSMQIQYVRGQQISMSSAQKLIRGVQVGCNLEYDCNTHATTMKYAVATQSNDKTANFAAEIKPDSGEWKVGMTKHTWATDSEFGAMVNYSDSRQGGKQSVMSFGIRKPLIGGGVVNAVISGFSKVKAVIEIPFGGDIPGMNQTRFAYSVQYGINNGAFKHGLTVTM